MHLPVTRRDFLAASVAAPIAAGLPRSTPEPIQQPRMLLAIHQNTSRAAGYRGSLEGWARAGIRYVELNDGMLDRFLETETLAAAGQVMTDNGLTPVSAVATLQDVWIPGPARAQSLDTFRRRCQQYATLGLQRIYTPSLTNREVTNEEWAATPDCVAEVGEIARQSELTAMIEFTRTSTHLSTLRTSLRAIREAGHPNVQPMLDFFHFWSGLSKFEDLDLLRPGELAHAHFQDLLDAPQERTDNNYRLIPGDGIAPVVPIIRKLAEKGYTGALSVELFRAEIVNGDPFEIGTEIRDKCERVMRAAGVA